MEKIKKKKSPVGIATILIFTFLTIYTLLLIIPFLWGILTSLKTANDFYYNVFGLPKQWAFSNYKTVLSRFEIKFTNAEQGYTETFTFARMMMNSVLYAFLATFVATTTKYIMAYATAKYSHYKLSKVIDAVVLVTMSLPTVGTLPSTLQIVRGLGLYNNFVPFVIITKMSFLSMHYFILGAFIRGIPKALSEAAEIDGANNLQIMVRIYAPLTISAYLTIFLLEFITYWNDYQTAYVFLKNFPTAAYGLWVFRNSTSGTITHLTMKLAANFLVALPILIVFILAHKKIMKGVSLGEGVKE